MKRSFSTSLLLAVGLLSSQWLLVACTGSQEELSAWMDPQAYLSGAGVEPFSNQKLTVAIKQEARQVSSLLAGEVNRRKEPLEAFPVDSMSMVGSVTKQGRPQALLRVDNLLYQVKVGDYIGQNYGKIKQISETNISFREIVQDAAGEWTERISSLQLQENAR
jgi:type IV pilus assembly protein PilP